MFRHAILTLSFILFTSTAVAQDFEFYPGARYDSNVPTLQSVLGFDWAEKITAHHELTQYLRALADYSPLVQLESYGKTWEDRPLHYLVIASRDNMARLDEIRKGIATLADPRGVEDAEIAGLIDDLPVIVWLSYGVHGNETSSPEAALLTAYHLLASQQDTLTEQILENTVIIIDPIQNPDGRDRFVNYFRQNRGRWPDPFESAAEHNEVWPGGRTNHYLFDMNRDWIYLSQRETQGKVKAFLDWYPQVFVDLHEMGSQHYYFPPTATPVNQEFTKNQVNWMEQFGRNNARWFDKMHFSYFTGEVFDAFYPGYGEGWPTFHGAIGMTYEESAVMGLVRQYEDKTTLHFREAVQRHFTSSLATLELAATKREALLQHFADFRKSAVTDKRKDGIRTWLLPPGDDSALTDRLTQLLIDQGIEVKRADASFTVDKTQDYFSNINIKHDFPAGTYIIDLAQPAGRLAVTLLSKESPMDEEFVKEQIRRQAKRLDHQIYDVTAWSLPLLFNVDCRYTGSTVNVSATLIKSVPITDGGVAEGPASLAYCVPWSSVTARLAAELQRRDIRLHMVDKAFTLKGQNFPAGSLIIKILNNPPDLYTTLDTIGRKHGVAITATETGWVEEGINFGSRNVHHMPKLKIAMAWNTPTSSYAAGWTRYGVEQALGYPVTSIRTEHIKETVLKDFNVLVLPSGGDYTKSLEDAGTKRIQQWVRDGGTLITIGAATHWATSKKARLLATRRELKGGAPDIEKDDEDDTPAAKAPADTFDLQEAITPDKELPERTTGAILQATLDTEHWLAFGYTDTMQVLAAGRDIFTPIKLDKGSNVGLYAPLDNMVTSGFVWEDTRKQLAQKAWLMHQPHQEGHVVAFSEDPNFRAATAGMQLLFMNAVLFGPAH
jgi:hypothetical protein